MSDSDKFEDEYRRLTPRSKQLMSLARTAMPRGLTRSLSWFAPYPVVFDHGVGPLLIDVDGNEYVDLFNNGLSLMHGHAYPPITEALQRSLSRGTAWPGASDAQIEFAELLCSRVPGGEQVRFTNTGTEATMLAVKLARSISGRPLILKGRHAYHGSYDDLEAGLGGAGEIPGRVLLAEFGDLESYRRQLDQHVGQIAAVIVEPVQYTGVVSPPPDGFLSSLQQLCADNGVLLILDDCLMFRLAERGSAQRFGFSADITCLGKWIGGGLPVGAVVSSAEIMSSFDPLSAKPIYHGGSFNGNLLGAVAGLVAVRALRAVDIERLAAQGTHLREAALRAASQAGLTLSVPGVDSVFGLYLHDERTGEIDWALSAKLHLAAVIRGIYFGSGGEFGLSTVTDQPTLERVESSLADAITAVACCL